MAPAPGRAVAPVERPPLSVSARLLLRTPVSRRFWSDRCYAGLSFLLAVPCCVFIVVAVILGLGLSFSFAGMLVGVPLLVVSLRAARWLGAVCRGLAGRLLGVRVRPRHLDQDLPAGSA
jgi:Putative sensor